ncbi:response regulator transcription factor [Desulfosporosinus metallidurans]|uniref:Stage 0 sporulation protein A homolog n=1 Tax=Desulfosporosinus metallidurans TaxID=1888891 RepID=A0A1Q8QL05_9FIRM|nr:response regulator [Desulfosporosinus metallidurans]OLN28023.1 Phosphate regulon transcriptional regulatory protein PhoB (SphR) [Desulfosporosinus metallidurans]
MNKKVLVADYDERIRDIVCVYLEADGFTVYQAEDGDETLELVGKDKPDLVIIDLVIAKLDAWAVFKTLKQEAKIPLIMLTGKGEENDRVLIFDLGADDYVEKPFKPRELITRIKTVLRRQ